MQKGILQSGGILDSEFILKVQMGNVPGYSTIDKFGVNLQITASTDPEELWEFGGRYNYDAFGTAPVLYLSSSSTADVGIPIAVEGLGIDGSLVQQTVNLNGQNKVTLPTPLWRVYRMENNGTVDLTGKLYCHIDPSPTSGVPLDAKVRAIIDDGHNQTLMCLYTIPKGKVGFLLKGEIGLQMKGTPVTTSEFAHCHFETRRVGKVFKVKKAITLQTNANSNYSDLRIFPDPIPALTDVKLTVVEVSATLGVWGTFDILLVDELKLSSSFLNKIGQPGY